MVYEQVPSKGRRQAHRALGWTVTDPEERALHLARAAEGPDAVVAAELDLAARHAAARGAPAAGAELYELAAALTPKTLAWRGNGGSGPLDVTVSRATPTTPS